MDLWEFYACVDALVGDLRKAGHASEADQVEAAIRGGATSGEILDRLSVALTVPSASVVTLADEADWLAEWARNTLPSQ